MSFRLIEGKNRRVALGVFLLFLTTTLPLACGGEKELPPGAVARVNNQIITLVEFEKRFSAARQGALVDPPGDVVDQLAVRAAFLDQLVERLLLEQLAARLKITVDEKEVNPILIGMRAGYQPADFALYLTEHHLDDLALRDRIRYSLLVDKLASRYAAAKLTITDKEMRDFYQTHLPEFTSPERIRLRQIVLGDEDFAFQTMNDIALGEPFEEAARTRSTGAERVRGGDLGYVAREMLPPEIAATAFALKIGEVSNVIRTTYGFHLLLVLDKKPAETLTFEQARATIQDRLRRQRADRLWRDFVAKLKARADIQVDRRRLLGTP